MKAVPITALAEIHGGNLDMAGIGYFIKGCIASMPGVELLPDMKGPVDILEIDGVEKSVEACTRMIALKDLSYEVLHKHFVDSKIRAFSFYQVDLPAQPVSPYVHIAFFRGHYVY